MLSNIRRNIMGTTSFLGKFDGMRKQQDFIVYPFKAGSQTESATIQSDTRIGTINLQTGAVLLSTSRQGGSYGVHLAFAKPAGCLSAENLLMLKTAIMGTASGKAGTNGIVYCDNSAALDVFAQVQA